MSVPVLSKAIAQTNPSDSRCAPPFTSTPVRAVRNARQHGAQVAMARCAWAHAGHEYRHGPISEVAAKGSSIDHAKSSPTTNTRMMGTNARSSGP